MKIVKKQNNSKHCIICGVENDSGVKASFYELDDGRLYSRFTFASRHQSYPERVHGGMLSAMIDELAGRAVWIAEPQTLGATTELSTVFRKPVPYDVPLQAVAEIISNSKRGFVSKAKILDGDGNILVEGKATYVKLPAQKIASVDLSEELNVFVPDNLKEVDL